MAVELQRTSNEIAGLIEKAVQQGESILAGGSPRTPDAAAGLRSAYLSWETRTASMLDACFSSKGFMTVGPKDEFKQTALALLDLQMTGTSLPVGRAGEVIEDIREKIRVLRLIEDRIPLWESVKAAPAVAANGDDSGAIFLVHGHDVGTRETVRRFLESVTDRQVIVLADQPNGGKDLLGKLLVNAIQASFAVVLLTPDDDGGSATSETTKPRARQNVVFELGLFIGLLGRDRVTALNHPTVEIPTDFSGVAYIPLSDEQWQVQLGRELINAGIDVDLNKAM